MKIINIYLAYNKLNMNCNNYDKFLKKSFNIISYVLQILLVFWNKRFFNGIKNSFFFNLTTLLSFYRQSEILFFRSTFWLYFLKRRWKYYKKVHSMYINNDVESRRTKPTVAGHSLNRDKLKVDSFTFIH